MKKYDGISVRSYASFREEARAALKGKWKSALLVFLALLLMTGAIIGANCTYTYSDESLFPRWELEASIGPFTTLSYWRNGNLYKDAATGSSSPFILPYNPLFVAAAALTAIFFLILSPISALAQMRLQLNLLDGITPDFSVLRTTARKYWLCVRTDLLILWSALWPMLLCLIVGMILAAAFPDLPIIPVLLILAGFVLLIIRTISYAATVYLVVTRPDMTARRAIRMSRQMMKGRKRRLVFLNLTFFGWELLFSAFAATLIMVLGETSLSYFSTLLSVLAAVPLYLYMAVAQTVFLRDADSRTNSQTPVSDMVSAITASLLSTDAKESPEENQSFSISDDPWANDGK